MSVIAYSALRQYIIHYALRVLQTLFTNKDTHMIHNCGTDLMKVLKKLFILEFCKGIPREFSTNLI